MLTTLGSFRPRSWPQRASVFATPDMPVSSFHNEETGWKKLNCCKSHSYLWHRAQAGARVTVQASSTVTLKFNDILLSPRTQAQQIKRGPVRETDQSRQDFQVQTFAEEVLGGNIWKRFPVLPSKVQPPLQTVLDFSCRTALWSIYLSLLLLLIPLLAFISHQNECSRPLTYLLLPWLWSFPDAMKMIFLKWTSSHAMLSVFFHCPSTPAHKLLSIFWEVLQDPPWLTFLATSALAVLPIRALTTLPLQNGSLSLSTWNITPPLVNSSSFFKPPFRSNSVGHPSYTASTPGQLTTLGQDTPIRVPKESVFNQPSFLLV